MMDQPKSCSFFLKHEVGAPEQLEIASGQAAVFSSRSHAKTSHNEDAAALIPLDGRRGVLAVADGVGGQPSGADAAEIALKALAECVLSQAPHRGDLRSAILNGFERANEDVTALGVNAATTLSVVELNGNSVRPYHAGDSVILVVGQRGKLKLQTIAHSPVGYAVEAGLLDEIEAIYHEQRHLVSNIVGWSEMKIEIGNSVKLAPRDTLLIASDGLFDNLHIPEIIDIVRKGPLLESAGELADACGSRMRNQANGQPSKPDDLTFILYRRDAGER